MDVINISDINDERLDIFYRTKEESLLKRNIFIGESELIINRALDNNYEVISFLVREKELDKYQDIFNRCLASTIYTVSDDIYHCLKGYILTRGILACFKRKEKNNLNELLNNSKRIVVLDNIENPNNVGSIIRNAAALNIDAVLITNDSADPLYRRAIRSSMGNIFSIDWNYIESDYIELLHKYNYKLVAFALNDNTIDLEDDRLLKEDKLAIILGSEGYGLKQDKIDSSDYVVKIKMNPSVDSLNVASASAIALYQLSMK